MQDAQSTVCRLCLVTPADGAPDTLSASLAEALAGGDVASLIIRSPTRTCAATLVQLAQDRGVAAIVHNAPAIALATHADGVQIDSGPDDLKAMMAARRNLMVGAGGLGSRHDAMLAGELEPDYLFFGRPDGDTDAAPASAPLKLAAWWSAAFVIPAILMGGRAIASVTAAASTGVEFVALGHAIWDHPKGPGHAVAEANRCLARAREPVS